MKTITEYLSEAPKIKPIKIDIPSSLGFGLTLRGEAWKQGSFVIVILSNLAVSTTKSFDANMKDLKKNGLSYIGIGDGGFHPKDKGKFVMIFDADKFSKIK